MRGIEDGSDCQQLDIIMAHRDNDNFERLDAMLESIAERVDASSYAEAPSLVQRRSDINKAVDFLLEHYGDEALKQARILEDRAKTPFAGSVREVLDSMSEEERAARRPIIS